MAAGDSKKRRNKFVVDGAKDAFAAANRTTADMAATASLTEPVVQKIIDGKPVTHSSATRFVSTLNKMGVDSVSTDSVRDHTA